MIEVSRIDGTKFMLNEDKIESITANPDTVITFTNGHRYVVSETPGQICDAIVAFKRRIYTEGLEV